MVSRADKASGTDFGYIDARKSFFSSRHLLLPFGQVERLGDPVCCHRLCEFVPRHGGLAPGCWPDRRVVHTTPGKLTFGGMLTSAVLGQWLAASRAAEAFSPFGRITWK